jgi:hypothetical protein
VPTSGRHVRPGFGGDMLMRLSLRFVAPSAVAILSTELLCGLSGTAVSQTALPSVTVIAPKQSARPHRPVRVANTTTARRTLPATQTHAQTPSAPPNSTLARLAEIERTSSNCTDACQTSLRHSNSPGMDAPHLATPSRPRANVRNFQTYFECREHGLFLGWRHNDVWWYCSSLAAGQKFRVADLKPPGRQR